MRRAWLGRWGAVLIAMSAMTPCMSWADQLDGRLDELFERLRTTEDQGDAAAIQQQIWQIWIEFEDLSISQLMRRGMTAMGRGDHAEALEAFDTMVDQAPGFAEAWNKRATVLYLMGRLDESVLDIKQTLELEPRHFGALSGLALIYDALDEPEAALRSLEAALKINPYFGNSKERMDYLREKMKGVRT